MTNSKHPILAHIEQNLHGREAEQKRNFAEIVRLDAVLGTAKLNGAEAAYDLIVADGTLTSDPDPEAALLTLGKTLKGDGLLLASLLGSESFKELVLDLPLPDVQSVGGVLQKLKFGLPMVDRDVLTLAYDDHASLAHDLAWLLQDLGITTDVQSKITADTPLNITVEVLYITAWRPHISQPRPLERGAFKIKISEVL